MPIRPTLFQNHHLILKSTWNHIRNLFNREQNTRGNTVGTWYHILKSYLPRQLLGFNHSFSRIIGKYYFSNSCRQGHMRRYEKNLETWRPKDAVFFSNLKAWMKSSVLMSVLLCLTDRQLIVSGSSIFTYYEVVSHCRGNPGVKLRL